MRCTYVVVSTLANRTNVTVALPTIYTHRAAQENSSTCSTTSSSAYIDQVASFVSLFLLEDFIVLSFLFDLSPRSFLVESHRILVQAIRRELNDHPATMSVRVVARVRPLLKSERDADVILRTGSSATADSKSRQSTIGDKTDKVDKKLAALRDRDNMVRIPNPKNEGEEYAFQFNAVYDAEVSQQELFDAEGE
jgi:hypothetical protein